MAQHANGTPSPDRLCALCSRRRLLRWFIAAGALLSGVGVLARVTADAGPRVPTRTLAPKAARGAATPNATSAASPAASPSAPVVVAMRPELRFDPANITIKRGTTVTWVNRSPIPHTATDDPVKNPIARVHPEYAELPPGAAPWDSGFLVHQGQTFSHTFTVPGRYRYFCIPHVLSGMRGSITVEP